MSPLSHYTLFVGLRYSFSRKRSRFTGVIAMISMLGMVLGVATLITVLSVMNGFGAELRQRILTLVPHGYVQQLQDYESWRELRDQLLAQPDVLGVSPYIQDKVILARAGVLRGALLTAVDPATEASVSSIPQAMLAGSLADLEQQRFGVVLGVTLARMLGVGVGDRVEVTVPRLTVTPLGVFPRTKRLTVVGLFEVGAQPDAYQAYVSLSAGQALLGSRGRIDGLQLRTRELFAAPEVVHQLAPLIPSTAVTRDWSQTQGSLFSAVKMEKVMVSILLLSVVAVAAFNIVSTLVMSVAEKRRDIAVLRTMGASAGGVMVIFLAHGLALGAVGIGIGAILGVLLAQNIAQITVAIEQALGVKLFDPAVYFISELPAQLQSADVVAVVLASLILSLMASLYPAWRAAQVAPAEVLRYE